MGVSEESERRGDFDLLYFTWGEDRQCLVVGRVSGKLDAVTLDEGFSIHGSIWLDRRNEEPPTVRHRFELEGERPFPRMKGDFILGRADRIWDDVPGYIVDSEGSRPEGYSIALDGGWEPPTLGIYKSISTWCGLSQDRELANPLGYQSGGHIQFTVGLDSVESDGNRPEYLLLMRNPATERRHLEAEERGDHTDPTWIVVGRTHDLRRFDLDPGLTINQFKNRQDQVISQGVTFPPFDGHLLSSSTVDDALQKEQDEANIAILKGMRKSWNAPRSTGFTFD